MRFIPRVFSFLVFHSRFMHIYPGSMCFCQIVYHFLMFNVTKLLCISKHTKIGKNQKMHTCWLHAVHEWNEYGMSKVWCGWTKKSTCIKTTPFENVSSENAIQKMLFTWHTWKFLVTHHVFANYFFFQEFHDIFNNFHLTNIKHARVKAGYNRSTHDGTECV